MADYVTYGLDFELKGRRDELRTLALSAQLEKKQAQETQALSEAVKQARDFLPGIAARMKAAAERGETRCVAVEEISAHHLEFPPYEGTSEAPGKTPYRGNLDIPSGLVINIIMNSLDMSGYGVSFEPHIYKQHQALWDLIVDWS